MTDGLWEFEEYRALCPHRQRNRFPLLEQHASNVLGLDEISADECHDCQCLACRDIGYVREWHPYRNKGIALKCRFGDCEYTNEDRIEFRQHEKRHYRKAAHKKAYYCMEKGCFYRHTTWEHLHSHTRSMHCKNAKGYYCPILWCRHNKSGFHRRSKWVEHMHKIHPQIPWTEVESLWAALIAKQQGAGTELPLTERHSSPSTSPSPEYCHCAVCEGVFSRPEDDGMPHKACRFPECSHTTTTKNLVTHEKTHFTDAFTGYVCAQNGCHHRTKRYDDLKRHYQSMHCVGPYIKCTARGCSFTTRRQDRIKEHVKHMHINKTKST